MNIIKQLPNLITLGNLFCGILATISAVNSEFENVLLFVLGGVFLDFFDGLVARLLKVSGELGKQLDSLADMVTSGVAPGITMFMLMNSNVSSFNDLSFFSISAIGLLLTLGACMRLAKFNIDLRQSDSFIGLPTPAMAIFVTSLPLIIENSNYESLQNVLNNNYVLLAITILLTYLMNAELPLFSLKFKNYSFKDNWVKYGFLVCALLTIFLLEILAIPLIILFYIVLSILLNFRNKKG